MYYTVQGMKLIPQKKDMSCWYASAQMLIQWRRDRTQMTEMDKLDPSEDKVSVALRDKDKGISDLEIIDLAQRLGLKAVPPQSPMPSAIHGWLTKYGPLWTNGKTHIVVIAGINYSSSASAELMVYDPAPVNTGKIEWRSMTNWYIGGAHDSRDTATRTGIFLYCPA
jgi:ABC-type bacteriocin/lantibiotic exporter with double-glycine peptidase domain